jgi:hypothetical protein
VDDGRELVFYQRHARVCFQDLAVELHSCFIGLECGRLRGDDTTEPSISNRGCVWDDER